MYHTALQKKSLLQKILANFMHISRAWKRLCRGHCTWPDLLIKANPEHCAAMQRDWSVRAHDYIAAHLLHRAAFLHLVHLSPNREIQTILTRGVQLSLLPSYRFSFSPDDTGSTISLHLPLVIKLHFTKGQEFGQCIQPPDGPCHFCITALLWHDCERGVSTFVDFVKGQCENVNKSGNGNGGHLNSCVGCCSSAGSSECRCCRCILFLCSRLFLAACCRLWGRCLRNWWASHASVKDKTAPVSDITVTLKKADCIVKEPQK